MHYLTKIDKERAERGVTMKQLAQDAGLAEITLKGLFSGKNTNTSVDSVLALCKALGISAASIFASKGEVVISTGAEDAALFEAIRKTPQRAKEILLDLLRFMAK